jgi:hypothetical protein
VRSSAATPAEIHRVGVRPVRYRCCCNASARRGSRSPARSKLACSSHVQQRESRDGIGTHRAPPHGMCAREYAPSPNDNDHSYRISRTLDHATANNHCCDPLAFCDPVSCACRIACSAAQLGVRMGQAFGNLSHGILYLTFTDHGTRPCTLRGMPDVQLLDKDGRLLATPRLQYAAADYVPTLANDGVGLTPLSNQGSAPGPSPEGGIRGQASLPVQYFDGGCGNNQVAALRIRVDGGSLITPVSLPGGGPGCIAASGVFVSPFQPAEFLP